MPKLARIDAAPWLVKRAFGWKRCTKSFQTWLGFSADVPLFVVFLFFGLNALNVPIAGGLYGTFWSMLPFTVLPLIVLLIEELSNWILYFADLNQKNVNKSNDKEPLLNNETLSERDLEFNRIAGKKVATSTFLCQRLCNFGLIISWVIIISAVITGLIANPFTGIPLAASTVAGLILAVNIMFIAANSLVGVSLLGLWLIDKVNKIWNSPESIALEKSLWKRVKHLFGQLLLSIVNGELFDIRKPLVFGMWVAFGLSFVIGMCLINPSLLIPAIAATLLFVISGAVVAKAVQKLVNDKIAKSDIENLKDMLGANCTKQVSLNVNQKNGSPQVGKATQLGTQYKYKNIKDLLEKNLASIQETLKVEIAKVEIKKEPAVISLEVDEELKALGTLGKSIIFGARIINFFNIFHKRHEKSDCSKSWGIHSEASIQFEMTKAKQG